MPKDNLDVLWKFTLNEDLYTQLYEVNLEPNLESYEVLFYFSLLIFLDFHIVNVVFLKRYLVLC